MNICESINSFNINNIYYLDAIKNTVIDNSNFIRILYSNEFFLLNGIYIIFKFKNLQKICQNNKIKTCFDTNNSHNLNNINFIKKLEQDLLKNCIIKNKKPFTKLKDQIIQGSLKNTNCIYVENKNEILNKIEESYILKISGIWESELEYGLTYKILDIQDSLTISSKEF